MNIFVLSSSFCLVSVVNAGLLGLSYEGGPQQVIDLSSVTSALTNGLQKVLDVIKNPRPVTIEIYSQEQAFPNPQYVDDNFPYGYPPPDPPQHPHIPPHPPHHHHHHHHGHTPPSPYPYPPPVGETGYPPHYPIGGTDNIYPNGQRYDGINRPNPNHYSDGIGQNAQQYGQNGDSYPGSYERDVEHQYGGTEGQNGNENGDNVSKLESQDTAEINVPVSDKQDETGIYGYINGFPVILLNEDEIR